MSSIIEQIESLLDEALKLRKPRGVEFVLIAGDKQWQQIDSLRNSKIKLRSYVANLPVYRSYNSDELRILDWGVDDNEILSIVEKK